MSIQIDIITDHGKRNRGQKFALAGARNALAAACKKLGAVALTADQVTTITTDTTAHGVQGLTRMGAEIVVEVEFITVSH